MLYLSKKKRKHFVRGTILTHSSLPDPAIPDPSSRSRVHNMQAQQNGKPITGGGGRGGKQKRKQKASLDGVTCPVFGSLGFDQRQEKARKPRVRQLGAGIVARRIGGGVEGWVKRERGEGRCQIGGEGGSV